jgi:hypothetical protein
MFLNFAQTLLTFRLLRSFVLNFYPFPINTPKTGLNVVNFVEDLLVDNGFVNEQCESVVIVTDEASNLNKFGKDII